MPPCDFFVRTILHRLLGICSRIPLLNTGKGATVTFLLRSLSTLEGDENLQPFVQDGKVHLVSGDALNKEDVIRGWKTAQEASESGRVDLVLFTVGEIDIQYHLLRTRPNIDLQAESPIGISGKGSNCLQQTFARGHSSTSSPPLRRSNLHLPHNQS